MKTGRLITHNVRYIHRTVISMEKYFQEQIKKGTGHLRICLQMQAQLSIIGHSTLMHQAQKMIMFHNENWERIGLPHNRAKELIPGLICHIISNSVPLEKIHPKTMILKSGHDSMKDEIRTMSGKISYRWERLGMDKYEHYLPELTLYILYSGRDGISKQVKKETNNWRKGSQH